MGLSVSYFKQQSNGSIGLKNLKSAKKDVSEKSQEKIQEIELKKSGLDLYNGEIDALTAKNLMMSNAGLQVKINENLAAALNFLNSKAAQSRKSSPFTGTNYTNTDIVSVKNETPKINPFDDDNLSSMLKNNVNLKSNNEDFLFIKVA